MWKWLIGILVVLLGLVGAGVFVVTSTDVGQQFQSQLTGGPSEPEGTPVRVEAAALGDLTRTVSAPGAIEPQTQVNISSQVSAKVLALPFREGQMVTAGDVVVRLDPQDLVARKASAEARLRSEEARLDGAKAGLINARLNYERLGQLLETGDVTQAEYDGAEAGFLQASSNLKVIEAGIEVAQAEIDQVDEDLRNTVIESPIDGVITALNTEVGETVIVGTTNNPGSVVMQIADLSDMLLKAQIDETNIEPVAEGQKANVFINAYSDREYDGVVQRIGLQRQVSSQGTGFFIVEIEVNLAEGETLLSGLSASTDVEVETLFDVIKVPSQAVFLDTRVDELDDDVRASEHVDEDKTFASVVYVFEDGKAMMRAVKVGPSDLTHTVIEAGVEAGEMVVVGPYRELINMSHEKAISDMEAEVEEEGEGTASEDASGEDNPEESPADGENAEASVAAEGDEPASDEALADDDLEADAASNETGG
ncbi:MAG: efflux RND transporter periplasmic adaptor subunit [Planctomycetota bacterium]